ncbi:MAG: alpha/beta fold hydrolase [Candidatus Margulisbacteria bacterium]|nr:alpha/beta fold hydrolase [Candidatus Margulisiibacteriota bacterium]
MLTYKQFGSGPLMVILHGLFGSGDNWQTLAKQFADRHTVVTIDLINHGLSPHRETMSYSEMARDVHEVIVHLNLGPVILLGHSMGGKVAMQFCSDYPEDVSRLIVADIAPKRYLPHHQEILEALSKRDVSSLEPPSLRQFLLKSRRRTETDFVWLLNIPAIQNEYLKILDAPVLREGLEVSTLFLRGETSDYILDSDKPDIYRYFPHAFFIEIKRAGHWLHAENPQDFFKAVDEFTRSGDNKQI